MTEERPDLNTHPFKPQAKKLFIFKVLVSRDKFILHSLRISPENTKLVRHVVPLLK